MQEFDSLAPDQFCQPPSTPPVESRPTVKHLDRKPLVAQLVTQASQLVEADEQEPIIPVQSPRQPSGQDLGTTHVQGVQNLSDRRHGRQRRG
jgi:hypothetical protein